MQPTSSTFVVNLVHAWRTGKFRSAAKIKYPAAYATEEQASKDPNALLFNCGMSSP